MYIVCAVCLALFVAVFEIFVPNLFSDAILCRSGRHPVLQWRSRARATGNLGVVQVLPGHMKIESMVRYLGADVEDALTLAEGPEI
jgi:hypothetical protein